MINLLPDAVQQALVTAVAEFLERSPVPLQAGDRSSPTTGTPATDWQTYAEMGWFGIHLPESLGGLGLSLAETLLIQRELGRHLVSPSVVAATAAAQLCASHDADLAQAIIQGERRVGLAHANGAGWHLIDGANSDLFLCVTGEALHLYPPTAWSGRHKVPALDGALTLEQAQCQAQPLFTAEDALPEVRLLLVAQMLGAAEAALTLAVEYTKVREQFGTVIASFQAIKHLCADLAVRAEAAWCQVVLAALSVRAGLDSAGFEVAAAEVVAIPAAVEITEQVIQLHGGIGFTAECRAHHHLKRVRLLATLLGGTRPAQARLLQHPLPQ